MSCSSGSGSLSGSEREHHQEQDRDRPQRQLGQGSGQGQYQRPNRNQERRPNNNYSNYSHQQRQHHWKNPNHRSFKKGIRNNNGNIQKSKYNKMSSPNNYGGQGQPGPSSSMNQQRRRHDSQRMPPPPPVLSRMVAVGRDQSQDLSIEQVTQFLEKVKNDKAKLKEENSELKSEISKFERMVTALKDERENLVEDVKRLEKRNKNLTKERDRMHDDEKMQKEKEERLELAKDELTTENKILDGKVKDLTAELVPMKEQNRILQQAVRNLFAAISDDDEMTFNFLHSKIYNRHKRILETQTDLQKVGFDFSEIKYFRIEKIPVPGSQAEEFFGPPGKEEGNEEKTSGFFQPGQGQQGQAQGHLGMGMVSPIEQPIITIASNSKIFDPPTDDEEGEATDSESLTTPGGSDGWSSRSTTFNLDDKMEIDERDLTTEEEKDTSLSNSPAKSDDKEKCAEEIIL